jgi:uncharacterized protein DUF3857/transglutaminase superfamily protein
MNRLILLKANRRASALGVNGVRKVNQAIVQLVVALAFISIGSKWVLADKVEWRPVGSEEVALKVPIVDKEADAEAIFWDVQVDDNGSKAVLSHYLRVKVFNERGRDSQSKIDLPYWGKDRIENVAGRTIKADGSIQELSSSAIFERIVVRARGVKIRVKSFALPGVEPGAIIEYRWQEQSHHPWGVLSLELQRDLPIQRIQYHLKISNFTWPIQLTAQVFNAPHIVWEQEKKGIFRANFQNVPAFHEEPLMPPEAQVRRWALVFATNDLLWRSTMWAEFNRTTYETYKSKIKPNTDVRKVAAEVLAGVSTSDEKLQRLFEFCRSNIGNIEYKATDVTSERREQLKPNKSPSETLERKMGTSMDIDLLFAALATAAGFEARVARLGDRSQIFFNHEGHLPFFLRSFNIAVKMGTDWRFFDPANPHVSYGMLRWQEEGTEAMISDPLQPIFILTPLSPPQKSVRKHKATLHLSTDGTLDGTVRVEYTGHCSAESKEVYEQESQLQREQALRDQVKQHLPSAEISEIQLDGIDDPAKPFSYSYHIHIPEYATRTGRRLILQPAFFQHGRNPRFPVSERKHSIYFDYPWSEEDQVSFGLPPGFAVETVQLPGDINVGTNSHHHLEMTVANDARTVQCRRSFMFGGESAILIPVDRYSLLKQFFDLVHERDAFAVALKPVAVPVQISEQRLENK